MLLYSLVADSIIMHSRARVPLNVSMYVEVQY